MMKDEAQDSHINSHSSCSLSTSCVRFVDELDVGNVPHQAEYSEESLQDERLLERLRTHVPTCPSCTAALEQARRVRSQQRRALHAILNEGEQRVPPTTAQILSVIQREQQSPQKTLVGANNHNHHQELPPALPFRQKQREMETPRPKRNRRALPSVLALVAVAAIMVASFGLFNYVLPHRPTTDSASGSPSLGMTPTLIPSTGWASVVVEYALHGKEIIANYDPISGKSVILATSPYPDSTSNTFDTTVEGVSHDGYKVLYEVYDGTKTRYYVYPQTKALYTVSGRGQPAIWSHDDRYIYIGSAQGVAKVDTLTAKVNVILPSLASTELLFERADGYLYFIKSYTGEPSFSEGTLNRVNLVNGNVQQITPCARGGGFWLSPSGSTVYYNCLNNDPTLYAVNSDGTNARPFRKAVGPMIGYAADGSPLTATEAQGKQQVVQRSPVGFQHDRVLLDNIAPHAETITADNIAVAPYGNALVAKGMYGRNSSEPEQLWYGNLGTGKSQRLLVPSGAQFLHVIGWNRLLIPGATPPTPQPTMESTLAQWHNVLVAENDANAGWTKLVDYDTSNAANFVVTINKPSVNAVVDGVSPNGKNVLYHDTHAGKTFYWTQVQVPGTGYFYTQNSNQGGNALWMPDNRHVLILSIGVGVREVDTQTGQVRTVLQQPLHSAGGQVRIGRLTFYREGYLYFVADDNMLYRVQVNNPNADVRPLAFRQPNTLYWLSPDGSLIYFANSGAAGQLAVYVVNSDGTNLHQLRPYADARPIGYAADGFLMVMRYVNARFQVVKLGATQAQDQVVLQDVVPGAVSLCGNAINPGLTPLCDDSIALAPLGGFLVVEAGYTDGSHRLWSIDLQSGQRIELATPLQGVGIGLIGWGKLAPPPAG